MQSSRGVPYTWLISLHVGDCRTALYMLPTIPTLLGQDLCHVRVVKLDSKLLICGDIVDGRSV